MIFTRKISIIFLIIISSNSIFAQNIDSLLRVLPKQKGINEIKTMRLIANEYMQINLDSSSFYLNSAYEKVIKINDKNELALIYRALGKLNIYQAKYSEARNFTQKAAILFKILNDSLNEAITYNNLGIIYEYLQKSDSGYVSYQKALKITTAIKDTVETVETYNNIGTFYFYTSNYDSAEFYYEKGLEILKNKDANTTKGALCNNTALVLHSKGDLTGAVDYYIKGISFFEKENDQKTVNSIINNIGALYLQMNFYNKAIEYFQKNRQFYKKTKNTHGYLQSINNLANCYAAVNQTDSALFLYNYTISIADTTDSDDLKSLLFKNLGDTYFSIEQYENAIVWLKKSLEIRESSQGNATNRITCYISLFHSEYKLNNKAQARKYMQMAEKLLNENSVDYDLLARFYLVKADYFESEGNYKQASIFYRKHIELNDSVINKDTRKLMSDLETKYQSQKKEHTIELQEIELEKRKVQAQKAQAEKQKRQAQRNVFIIAFILTIILAVVIFKSYLNKIKTNKILNEQKHEIEQKNEELKQQNEEILSQRDEIQTQKDEINNILTELNHSINYAKRIQTAVLPSENILNTSMSDSFLMFRPKDKVSGDFYWWTSSENYTIVTAADCTGHGVPGALMSMLGISLIRESILRDHHVNPANILNKIRKEIIKTLTQTGKEGEQKDGMDLSLICINHRENKLVYAGANNPVYIIKKEKINSNNPKIIQINENSQNFMYEIKADRMPLAIYRNLEDFNAVEIPFEPGDSAFLFSDGFADQFGGPKNTKFKYMPFKEMIFENAEKPMSEQKILYENIYDQWKQKSEQVDDVLLLGIKF